MANKQGSTVIYCPHANMDNHAHMLPDSMFVMLEYGGPDRDVYLGLCPVCAAIVRGTALTDVFDRAARNIILTGIKKG